MTLESWWQCTPKELMENRRNIAVICPHPGSVLDKNTKDWIGTVHSVPLHLQHYIYNKEKAARPFRFLIAEPEADMQVLYRRFLDALGTR